MLPFFVYGTLRPGHRNHDRHLAGRYAAVGPAVLEGAALHDGPGYPYAVAAPGGRVHGDLVTVRAAVYPLVLAELDRLERCRADGLGEYVRVRLTVTAEDGEPVPAWVYLAGRLAADRLRGPIPSGDWNSR